MEFLFPALQEFFSTILSFEHFGLNFLDIVILIVIAFYAYEGYMIGFTLSFIDLITFIASFLLALAFYSVGGELLIKVFDIPPGFANALGFFLTALVSEVILGFILRRLLDLVPTLPENNPVRKVTSRVNHPLGLLPGFLSAVIILSFLLTVIVALPSSPVLKELVTASRFGGIFVASTSLFEQRLSGAFGGAIQETLNVLTVKPESDETVDLKFAVVSPVVNQIAEAEMLKLLNQERVKEGLPALEMDEPLRELARDYSRDMLQRGYFSHYNPEGQSPFDRMEEYGISYTYAGENLALAPSVKLAHQGLMNSPGHRANILSPNFKRVGIGVMDGGIYGKMFSQEFTD